MKIDGTCHCGNITYQAEIDPEQVYICHCTDCQSICGTAFRWGINPAPECVPARLPVIYQALRMPQS